MIDKFNAFAIETLRDGFLTPAETQSLVDRFSEIQAAEAQLGFVSRQIFEARFTKDITLAIQLKDRIVDLTEATKQQAEAERALATARAEAITPDDTARQNLNEQVDINGVRKRLAEEAAAAAQREDTAIQGVSQSASTATNALSALQVPIDSATQSVGNLQTALNNLTVPDLNIQPTANGQAADSVLKGQTPSRQCCLLANS
ncbi:MAG: hypothetical protein ACW987_13975 [Candidatus Thorarchaeota archaeon]